MIAYIQELRSIWDPRNYIVDEEKDRNSISRDKAKLENNESIQLP